jgi:hypothetical protein
MEQVSEVSLPDGWHKVDAGTFKATTPGASGERSYVFEEAGCVRGGPLDHVLATRDANGIELPRF